MAQMSDSSIQRIAAALRSVAEVFDRIAAGEDVGVEAADAATQLRTAADRIREQ